MPTPYDEMWEKLNLDLAAHEGLLQVLGKFYGDIYLPQSGRLIVPDQPDLVGALGAALYGERGRRPALAETAAAS